jgi:DNA-binding transcriptional MerR regulator
VDQYLISKKELLQLANISYGQLYRWKRKNLIPEEWFIRKSTFTGQETFFPREKILARLEKIKHMKDDLSLDELADMFSPYPSGVSMTKTEIIERNIVAKISLDCFLQHCGNIEEFSFQMLLYLYILDKMLVTGEMSLDEGKLLLQVLQDHYPRFERKNSELLFIRKMGVPLFILVSCQPDELCLDDGAKVVQRLNLAGCVEELKVKIL